MKNYSIYLFALMMTFMLASCGGEGYIKYPVDEIVKQTPKDKLPLSVILYDMDVKGSRRMNKYKVITNVDDSTKKKETITPWKRVSKQDFAKNYNNMGMELASKRIDSTGKEIVSKVPAPPGYSNYVGNKQYGQWRTNSNGESFWSFYGKYMFLSSMFNMATYPVRRSYYSNYRRNYYGRRPYYGGTGSRRMYGTGSRYSRGVSSRSYYSSGRYNRTRSSYSKYRSSRSSRSGSRSGYSSRSRSGSSGK
jgi:predicted small lipoprotein YifL